MVYFWYTKRLIGDLPLFQTPPLICLTNEKIMLNPIYLRSTAQLKNNQEYQTQQNKINEYLTNIKCQNEKYTNIYLF